MGKKTIAEYVEEEGQFEVLREQLNYNFIYNQEFFLELEDDIDEVILLSAEDRR